MAAKRLGCVYEVAGGGGGVSGGCPPAGEEGKGQEVGIMSYYKDKAFSWVTSCILEGRVSRPRGQNLILERQEKLTLQGIKHRQTYRTETAIQYINCIKISRGECN